MGLGRDRYKRYSVQTGCFAHVILLELIILLVFVDKCRSHESRHYAVSSSPVTSSVLGPDIFLSINRLHFQKSCRENWWNWV